MFLLFINFNIDWVISIMEIDFFYHKCFFVSIYLYYPFLNNNSFVPIVYVPIKSYFTWWIFTSIFFLILNYITLFYLLTYTPHKICLMILMLFSLNPILILDIVIKLFISFSFGFFIYLILGFEIVLIMKRKMIDRCGLLFLLECCIYCNYISFIIFG